MAAESQLFKWEHKDTGMVIAKKSSSHGNLDLSIKPVSIANVEVGDVIAVNGVSLEVLEVSSVGAKFVFSVTIPKHILKRTNFLDVESGSRVTLQKPDAAGTVKGCPDIKCYWKWAKVYRDSMEAYLKAVEGEESLMNKIKANSLVALNGEVYQVESVDSKGGYLKVKYPPDNAEITGVPQGKALPAHLQQVGAGAKGHGQGTPMNVEINVAYALPPTSLADVLPPLASLPYPLPSTIPLTYPFPYPF